MSDNDYNGFLDTLSSDYDEQDSKVVLFIETLTGTAFEMMVCPTDTVLSIKNKIQHDEGIPVTQQHLLFGDRELRNDARLEEQGITRGATLRLVLGMRGGPINTRRASSRDDQLVWREIQEFVDSTRDEMMSKVPPGSKITLLFYKESETTVNLLKVIENEDGSYSPLSDFRKPLSARSRSGKQEPDVARERLRENTITMSKLSELRRKMEDLSVKRMNKQKTTRPNDHSENVISLKPNLDRKYKSDLDLSTTNDRHAPIEKGAVKATHKTDKTHKMKKYTSFFDESFKSKSKSNENKVKQWSNSDYYDHPVLIATPKEKYKKPKCGGANLSDSSDESCSPVCRSKIYKSRPTAMKPLSLPPMRKYSHFSNEPSSSYVFQNDRPKREWNGPLVDSLSYKNSFNDISVGDKTSKILAEYYPHVSRNETECHRLERQFPTHRKQKFEESTTKSTEDLSISGRSCTTVHQASSIAILEEEPEASVGNDEPDFTPAGPISVPSPDANTFTISQIPRERVSTATGTTGSRNRFRVARFVLKEDDERPKTSPEKFNREVYEFLLSDSDHRSNKNILCESSRESQSKSKDVDNLRFKRTKYIRPASPTFNNMKDGYRDNSISTVDSSFDKPPDSIVKPQKVGSLSGYNRKDKLQIMKIDNNKHHREVSNLQKKVPPCSHKYVNLNFDRYGEDSSSSSDIFNAAFVDTPEDSRISNEKELSENGSKQRVQNLELNLNFGESNSKKFRRHSMNLNETESKIVKIENTGSSFKNIDTLPLLQPIKKTTRVRCKQCNKRLNITTIHTCRCGDNFCSQHRYSEVHGCQYDYKTEGRKLIHQANPLVLATKLPKI